MAKITDMHRAPCPTCKTDTLHIRYVCQACQHDSEIKGLWFWSAEHQRPHGQPFMARSAAGDVVPSGYRAWVPGDDE
jgi:hypothetical protein